MSIIDPSDKPDLEIGDLIKNAGAADDRPQAIVIDRTEDGSQLLLLRLPTGEPTEISRDDAQAWTVVAPPSPRWVEVYEAEASAPFFAAYVPDIDAAIAIYRAFEAREGDFKVEIYTNDDRENETLDGIGYFGSSDEA